MARPRSLERAIDGLPRSRKITDQRGLSQYAVDGKAPEAAVFPNTLEEMSNLLALAEAEGKAVVPWGGGTSMALGNVPRGVDLVIGTSRLNRILEHEPADLTVIVEGGVALGVLQGELAEKGQFLPLDPPMPDRATIGGILASGASGPRRACFGPARDRLIGIKVAHPNGEVTKAGGRVVKNVTGYDMNKLYAGSLGTLGIIVEAAFKVAPLFKEEKTLLVPSCNLALASRLALDIPKLGVQPLALEIVDPQALELLHSSVDGLPEGEGYALAVELGGTPASASRQVAEIGALCSSAGAGMASLDDREAAQRLWSALRDLGRRDDLRADMIAKLTCLPSDVARVMEGVEGIAEEADLKKGLLCSATIGIVHAYWWGGGDSLRSVVDRLRGLMARFNGHCVIESCPVEVKAEIDVWGMSGPQTALMRRIKEQFDPKGILNPGRFVDGI